MFYILLIIPHIAAIWGLLWFAFREGDEGPTFSTGDDGWWGGDDPTPPAPRPLGPPLSDAEQPRPRLAPGEPLADRSVRPPRRGHPPLPPRRVPERVPDDR